jgi:phosphopantetheinyl transferase
MPLVYQQNINESTKIGVWHITEPESFFLTRVAAPEYIHHPKRRLQHLAGRYLLNFLNPEISPESIVSGQNQKPFINDHSLFFSIAHSEEYAAAIVCGKSEVGIDIQTFNPKLFKIKEKFITNEDIYALKPLMLNETVTLTLGWSIKECVFKWYGLGGVDFNADIQIKSAVQHEAVFQIQCDFKKSPNKDVKVVAMKFPAFILAWMA